MYPLPGVSHWAYGKAGIWNPESGNGIRETNKYKNDSSFGSMIDINTSPPFSVHSLQDG